MLFIIISLKNNCIFISEVPHPLFIHIAYRTYLYNIKNADYSIWVNLKKDFWWILFLKFLLMWPKYVVQLINLWDHISSPIPNLKILPKILGGSENEANKRGVGIWNLGENVFCEGSNLCHLYLCVT